MKLLVQLALELINGGGAHTLLKAKTVLLIS